MFITLEGIEGCGKTTQIQHLATYLENRRLPFVVTREPGGTAIGENIRAILLNPENRGLDPTAELLLYMADRAQHIHTVIKPRLGEGKIVICDRYYDATVVYQGYARGLDTRFILDLHKRVLEDLKPDITFLLDVSPRIGLARAWKQLDSGERAGKESRFEEETVGFHEKVRAGYLKLAGLDPERIHIIDASQGQEQVQEDIRKTLMQFLR
jgi:dTMP kinase